MRLLQVECDFNLFYFAVAYFYHFAADSRDLNYDKFVVNGQVQTESDEAYTSHNTKLLDVEGTVKKILTTDYVKEQLAEK